MTKQNRPVKTENTAPDHQSGLGTVLLNAGQKRLQERLILEPALALNWAYTTGGWKFPLFNVKTNYEISGWRWKNLDSQATPKYKWLKGNPQVAPYYFKPGLVTAIAAAAGVLYLVEGEPDVLTFHANELFNVISFSSGASTIPAPFAADLAAWGVQKLIQVCDNDAAGLHSGAMVRQRLAETGIEHQALVLRVKDPNELWQLLGGDRAAFQQELAQAQAADLPTLPPPTAAPPADSAPPRPRPALASGAVDWEAEYEQWQTLVQQAVKRLPRGNSKTHYHCPNPHHEDRHPSFRIGEKGVPVCTCGIQLEKDPYAKVAAWVGVISWADYKAQRLGFRDHADYEERRPRPIPLATEAAPAPDPVPVADPPPPIPWVRVDLTEPDPAHLAEVLATEPPPARVYRPLNPAVAARIRAEAQARGYPHASDGSSVIIDGQNYRPRQLCQRWGIDFITRGGLYDYTPPPAPATPQEHYRTPQLDPALALPPGIVVIQSPMGSGKTHLIFQHLVRHLHDHPEARVLFVTYRIALAYEICRAARAHNLAVMNYDVEGREVDPATCQLFVTTVNSLHKLAQSPDLPTYDITVIDEMEGVCEHLCGATLAQGEQARNARNLVEHFIQTSAQVIAADAYISTVSYNFLNRHRGPHPKPHFILNTCPPTKERITFTSHAEALQDELVADLQQGQTVLVLSDSLRYAQQLYQRLAHRGFNLHLITSENSRDPANLSLLEQLGQGDPLPGQGLICSPVLGAGFDVQSPIATVYAFFSNQSITPEAQMQMLGRARQAQTAKCYVAYRTTPYETDRAAIYHELHLDYTQTRLSLQASGHYAPRWEKGHLELAHDELALIELQVDVERKHRCQGLTPFECLLAYARQFYREVTFATPDPHPSQVVVRAEMHAIRQARQAAEDVAILAADPVAPATWQHAQATGTATPELKAGHHKQEIMAGYGVAAEAVTAELIHDWQTGGLERLQRFVDMSLPIEAITARDWLQVEQNVPVIHRDHALSTYILFGALLQTIFGDTLHTHKIPAAELFERLKVFQHLFERFEAHTHFKRGHTASKNPMAWFRHILSLYGLRLQRHRPGKGHRNENNTYQLCPKSLAKMLAKANQLRAAQGLPPLEAEAIRLEGGQHLGLFQSLAVKPRYRVVQRRSPPP